MSFEHDDERLESTRHLHPIVKSAIGVTLGVAAVAVVLSAAGGIGEAVAAIGRMRPGFVFLAFVFAFARLALFGVQLRLLGRRTGPLGAGTAFGLALVVFGFGALTPAAPAEGMAIASRELRHRGRSKQQAWMTCGFSEWFAQRTFYGIAALDLIVVIVLGHLDFADSWPLMVVAFVVLMALVGSARLASRPASAVWISRVLGAIRIRRPQRPREARQQSATAWHANAMALVGPPRNRVRLAVVSASAVLADTATLWATCHAAGFHIHPELTLLAIIVGTMVSWVPLLPGGLGLVEAAIPTVLHRFGAPLDDALAATLVYRAAAAALPALAGGIAILVLRARRTTAIAALPDVSSRPERARRAPPRDPRHPRCDDR